MDLFTHALIGFASGSVVASFTNKPFTQKLIVSAMGMMGGMLPDVDAISMWSKFDSTFGCLFGLKQAGKIIYSGKFWYSHHAFFHSIFAAFFFTVLVVGISKLIKKRVELKSYLLYGLAFLSGYLFHLICDMPTPASSWGGVNLFWPSKVYIGGYAKIWWWNNYDVFLIILVFCLTSLAISFCIRRPQKLVSSLFFVACFWITLQICTRKEDYSDTIPYTKREEASKKEQLRILGPKLFNTMEKLDKRLPLHF